MRGAPRDFDAEADEWDRSPARVRVAGAVVGCLIDRLTLRSTMRVLDYGCGTGLVTLPLAARVGPVVAVDQSDPMLAILRRKLRVGGRENISPLHADLERNDAVGQSFDLVVCTQTLTHVKDAARVIAMLRDVLAPAGMLAISEMDLAEPAFGGFDRRELRALVEDAGLALEGIWDALEVNDFTAPRKRYYVLAARRAPRSRARAV